ncbi:hypothetical protein [Rhodopirellula baltica]|uniref:hypothetical protein n=1 Tax=Rhodopirellula baltica TaxID=265606 RepID=UPI001F1C29F4|nr:hypothetical protein [Rhodopirellula baltica]
MIQETQARWIVIKMWVKFQQLTTRRTVLGNRHVLAGLIESMFQRSNPLLMPELATDERKSQSNNKDGGQNLRQCETHEAPLSKLAATSTRPLAKHSRCFSLDQTEASF